MNPFATISSWLARRRHNKRVAVLRKAELELAEAEARQKRIELLQSSYMANGSFGTIHSRDMIIDLAGEVAALKKHVEHLRHDVYERVS